MNVQVGSPVATMFRKEKLTQQWRHLHGKLIWLHVKQNRGDIVLFSCHTSFFGRWVVVGKILNATSFFSKISNFFMFIVVMLNLASRKLIVIILDV